MKKGRPSPALEREVANLIAPSGQSDSGSGKEILPGTSDHADLLVSQADLTKPLELTDRSRELLVLIEQLFSRRPFPHVGNSPLIIEPE